MNIKNKPKVFGLCKKLGCSILMQLPWNLQEQKLLHTQKKRTTWSRHGVAGKYIVPELEHYRCYKML